MAKRSRFEGTRQIIVFNWPFYAASCSGLGALWAILKWGSWPRWCRWLGYLGLLTGSFWNVSSLVASWWVYDFSPLMQWRWLREFFPTPPKRWANFHAGLDESTPELTALFGKGRAFDFYDTELMTEPSIQRARRLFQPEIEPQKADFRALPLECESLDAAFLFFAAHEIRQSENRELFFAELSRVLAPNGTLILVEHVLDAANFAVFGPGALHFWSAAEWERLGRSDFDLLHTRRMTPFVRVFVWKKRESV